MKSLSALYSIAETQAGYFTSQQARQAGVSKSLLSYHLRQGRVERIRPGVYRLAQFPEMPHADLFVAWLATRGKGVISHESALALYGLSDLLPAEIHLTVPRTASRRISGVRLHTCRLSPHEVTHREGLSVTTLPRTLHDLLHLGVSETIVAQAIEQALEQGLLDKSNLQTEARRYGRRLNELVRRILEKKS